MFVLCAVLINRLGHGSTSEIIHIIPEPYPQLEYHTVAWLWNIWFPSGMKKPCKGEEWHLENREELSIRLARFYPPSILPSNRRTCSQVETEGGWLTSQLRLLSPEEWTRLQERLESWEAGAAACLSPCLKGCPWCGQKFKCGPGTQQELPGWHFHILISCSQPLAPEDAHSFEKNKSGWILSHQWHLRGYSLSLERLPKKPPSFGDGGAQFYFEKQYI